MSESFSLRREGESVTGGSRVLIPLHVDSDYYCVLESADDGVQHELFQVMNLSDRLEGILKIFLPTLEFRIIVVLLKGVTEYARKKTAQIWSRKSLTGVVGYTSIANKTNKQKK